MIVPAVVYTEQASVTNWPVRLALVALMLAIIAVVLWGMLRGWRSRQRRQADLPPPAPFDSIAHDDDSSRPEVTGLYVGTSTAGDWLDRIAVHGLGVRSRARVSWSRVGIGFERDGASSFSIPAGDVEAFRTDRGVAGTVRAKDSVIIITWRLGSRMVETGFRADDSVEHRTLLDGLMAIFPEATSSSGRAADGAGEGAGR